MNWLRSKISQRLECAKTSVSLHVAEISDGGNAEVGTPLPNKHRISAEDKLVAQCVSHQIANLDESDCAAPGHDADEAVSAHGPNAFGMPEPRSGHFSLF